MIIKLKLEFPNSLKNEPLVRMTSNLNGVYQYSQMMSFMGGISENVAVCGKKVGLGKKKCDITQID